MAISFYVVIYDNEASLLFTELNRNDTTAEEVLIFKVV